MSRRPGDGKGIATPRLKPEPRDFTSGKYKFRTTPSGLLPTDADIAKVIKQGLPYTSMPGWPNFSDSQIQEIVYYLKSFSEDFADPSKHGDSIDLPEPPPYTEESAQRGSVVYEEQGCAACHGLLGRGDGTSAPTLTDDWGKHIRPADMTQRWTFRGGPTRKDMFRTFSTGLNGTPMPSYFDSLAVEGRWDLVNYMQSLGTGDTPDYASLLLVSYRDDEIDIEQGQAQFEGAPLARFPLVGQVTEPGRDFYPSTTSIEVQAIYNRNEIAFLLRWHDMRSETAGTNGPDLAVPTWDEDQPGSAACPTKKKRAASGATRSRRKAETTSGATRSRKKARTISGARKATTWPRSAASSPTPWPCSFPRSCPAESASPTSCSETRSTRSTCGSSTWRARCTSSSSWAAAATAWSVRWPTSSRSRPATTRASGT